MTPAAPLDTVAFKLIDAAEWRLALSEGVYEGSAVDQADGFIHLSTAGQLEDTARKHYAGRSDLMVLSVDLAALGGTVVWEPSRGGDLFPHIYGPMPTSVVTKAQVCAVSSDGALILADAAT